MLALFKGEKSEEKIGFLIGGITQAMLKGRTPFVCWRRRGQLNLPLNFTEACCKEYEPLIWQIIHTVEKKKILPQKLKVLADCTTSLDTSFLDHVIDCLVCFKTYPQPQLKTFITFGRILVFVVFFFILN